MYSGHEHMGDGIPEEVHLAEGLKFVGSGIKKLVLRRRIASVSHLS